MTKDNGFNKTGASTQAATQALRDFAQILNELTPDDLVEKAIKNLEEESGFHFLNKEEREKKLSHEYMKDVICIAGDNGYTFAQTARIAIIRDRIERMFDYRFLMRPDMNLIYNIKTGELLITLIPLKISFDDDDARLGDFTKFYSTDDEWDDDYTQVGTLGIMVATYPLMRKIHEGDDAALKLDKLVTSNAIFQFGDETSKYRENFGALIEYKRSKLTLLTRMNEEEMGE